MIGYVLLALGIAAFVLSFVLPAKTDEEKTAELSEDMIRDMVGKEVESAKEKITEVVDETITYAMEKSERSMERLTNEKIMAVNEYSDTVLSDIDKNHKEVVFLYDMLNDKHENIKTTVADAEKTAAEVKQAVKDAEITVREAAASSAAAAPAHAYGTASGTVPASGSVSASDMVSASGTVPGSGTVSASGMSSAAADFPVSSSVQSPASLDAASVSDSESFVLPQNDDTVVSNAASASEELSGGDILREMMGMEEGDFSNAGGNVKPGGRMSAIDRLKAAKGKNEDFKPIIIERADPSEEVTKKSRRKKKEEKRSVPEDELMSYVANKPKEEVPDLNLGDDPVRMGGRNNNDRILELHNAGKSNMAIAKELGLGIGEVKLVIDLFEGM